MIRENEILALLGNEIPGLKAELDKIDDKKSTYKMARCFGHFTYRSIERNQQSVCKKCLRLAEKFYLDGERNVRNAIENIYTSALAKALKGREDLASSLPVFMKDQFGKKAYS